MGFTVLAEWSFHVRTDYLWPLILHVGALEKEN